MRREHRKLWERKDMLDSTSSALPRHLGLAGTYNLRDTGGYRTIDGRTARWRAFLRSDSLHRVPPMAGPRCSATVCARSSTSGAPTSCTLLLTSLRTRLRSCITTYHCWQIACLSEEVAPRSLPDVYRMILEQRQEQLYQTLATLAAPTGFPAIVHCTARRTVQG